MLPTSFITSCNVNEKLTVIIDGKAPNASKTHFKGEGDAVQLGRAEASESGFKWSDARIKAVIAKNILIYDEKDANCLGWFLQQGMKIDLSASHISPQALQYLTRLFESLKHAHVYAVEGSVIPVPMLQGLSGIGKSDYFALLCREMGFKTFYS